MGVSPHLIPAPLMSLGGVGWAMGPPVAPQEEAELWEREASGRSPKLRVLPQNMGMSPKGPGTGPHGLGGCENEGVKQQDLGIKQQNF